ncbi:hypothetical protein SLS60_001074 [Paraconiothyrium brasiliense]|uniref:BTB domain-containing protein n=1 Tax=Paraconiothyrium brasiliense TaxID=300254 RepID=A0ABR3S823_9PLEO
MALTAYDNMMTIQVTQGTRKKKFRVYRGVLCFHSDFFDHALNGAFGARGLYFYEVMDCTIETFQIFYDWTNTGVQDKKLSDQQAFDLFLFADFYAIPALKNRALESYHCSFLDSWTFSFSLIQSVYLYTMDGSSLRKLTVDQVVKTLVFETVKEDLSGRGMPEECLLDIIQACGLKRFITSPQFDRDLHRYQQEGWIAGMRMNFCHRYHDHVEAEQHAAYM